VHLFRMFRVASRTEEYERSGTVITADIEGDEATVAVIMVAVVPREEGAVALSAKRGIRRERSCRWSGPPPAKKDKHRKQTKTPTRNRFLRYDGKRS